MTVLSLTAFAWLTGTALVSWVLPPRHRHAGMALACAAFLALYAPLSLGVLAATALLSHGAYRSRRGAPALLGAVASLAGLLVWFKLERPLLPVKTGFAQAIPLGLSYYVFKQIHYLFEAYKGRLEAHGLGEYLAYLFFLPTLMAGPINLFGDFRRDLRRRRFDAGMLSSGMERILHGYAKIVILANYLVAFHFGALVFDLRISHPALAEYLDCLRHALEVYFQFSGYSDVAIGFGLVMGFRIIENFNYPFLATNINEVWRRWHISLSGWCRSYVFTPIAAATRLPYPAIIASMLVLALWHDITWGYLLWGLYHGAGIAIWQLFQRAKRRLPRVEGRALRRLVRLASSGLTMTFVILGFALVKEPSIEATGALLRRLVGLGG